jgi:LysM repeat protein
MQRLVHLAVLAIVLNNKIRSVLALALLVVVSPGASIAPASDLIHVVRKNDTLYDIARQYGISENLIATRNKLKNANRLRAGEKLVIPGAGGATSREYVIRKGDSLATIARAMGVPMEALAEHNQIKEPDRIIVGHRLLIPAPGSSRTEYVVRKGDSLAAIAARFGLSATELARFNSLDRPGLIVPGQVLLIPRKRAIPPAGPRIDPSLKDTLDPIRVPRNRWRKIVIHHSGNEIDTPKSMDAYHRRRNMENGLAYHFVIGNGRRVKDGEIFVGNRWIKQLDGGHLASYSQNQTSIGICLVGNFNKHKPTAKQMRALEALTAYLMDRCNLPASDVQTHREINVKPTECPGRHFPTRSFLADLKR